MSLDPVQATVRVQLPPNKAFARFTQDFQSWWPREYTWSQTTLDRIGIEPRPGGLCYEIGPHGFRVDWGQVRTWAPPRHLVLLWQIGPHRDPQPDPAKASEIDIGFSPIHQHLTEVTLTHRGFERHGSGAAEYRAAMASAMGWPRILHAFAAAG